MPKAIVLGAGMVGSVMAADLVEEPGWDISIADVRPRNLKAAAMRCGGRVRTIEADLAKPQAVKKLVREYDIVLGALASAIGFQTLRAVIEAGKNYCDISFMPQNAIELDDLAKKHGVAAIVDCGVAPGMSNMMAGHGYAQLEKCEKIEIYVGGLPRVRRWPFQYKAGFSPHDVIEEYTRPSRIVEHCKIVEREALSEPELMDLPGVGTVEAFNTDGLRSLAYTLDVPFMKEKTLRYPGHIELMRVFRATGLFSEEPIEVDGVKVKPRDVIAALMFPKWMYEESEEDLTVMRVMVEGIGHPLPPGEGRVRGSSGSKRVSTPRAPSVQPSPSGRGDRAGAAAQRVRYTWDLLDFYDPKTKATSMSRTTAFPCTIMARMVASGAFEQFGVIPPEFIGQRKGMLQKVMTELERRGVRYSERTQVV